MLSSIEWNQLLALKDEKAQLGLQEKCSVINSNEKAVVEQYLDRRIENLEIKKRSRL